MTIITKFEIEEALSKLLFNITASISYKPYEHYKVSFVKMLDILNTWIRYYVEDGNLLRMNNDEVNNIIEAFNTIPFEAFNGDFYEEVDIWLTVVVFYGSCPINEEFDEKFIVRKGSTGYGR